MTQQIKVSLETGFWCDRHAVICNGKGGGVWLRIYNKGIMSGTNEDPASLAGRISTYKCYCNELEF
jgi:hypothetical protein